MVKSIPPKILYSRVTTFQISIYWKPFISIHSLRMLLLTKRLTNIRIGISSCQKFVVISFQCSSYNAYEVVRHDNVWPFEFPECKTCWNPGWEWTAKGVPWRRKDNIQLVVDKRVDFLEVQPTILLQSYYPFYYFLGLRPWLFVDYYTLQWNS